MRKNRKAFGMLSTSFQELKNLFFPVIGKTYGKHDTKSAMIIVFGSHKRALWPIFLKGMALQGFVPNRGTAGLKMLISSV